MTTFLIITSSLLGLASAGSGFAKLAKVPQVMESMASVGVKPHQIPLLALLEIAGTAGLIVGIWIQPIGVLASVCLALYFLGAVASHLRKKFGFAEFAPALVILLTATVVSYLQFKR